MIKTRQRLSRTPPLEPGHGTPKKVPPTSEMSASAIFRRSSKQRDECPSPMRAGEILTLQTLPNCSGNDTKSPGTFKDESHDEKRREINCIWRKRRAKKKKRKENKKLWSCKMNRSEEQCSAVRWYRLSLAGGLGVSLAVETGRLRVWCQNRGERVAARSLGLNKKCRKQNQKESGCAPETNSYFSNSSTSSTPTCPRSPPQTPSKNTNK